MHRALTAYALVALLALVAGAQAAAGEQPPADAPGAEFDRLAAEIVKGTRLPTSPGNGRQRIAQIEATLPPDDPVRSAQLARMRCFWAFDDRPQQGLEFAAQQLAEAEARADSAALADLRFCHGYHTAALGDNAAALRDYAAGLEHAEFIGDQQLIADGLSSRGNTWSLIGEQASALQDLLRAQQIYEKLGLDHWAGENLFSIATTYRRLGEYDKAREYFSQREQAALRAGDNKAVMNVKLQRGYLQQETGDLPGSENELRGALAIATENADPQSIALVQLALASVLNGRGSHAEALLLLDQAQAALAQTEDTSNTAMLHLEYGNAHAGLGANEKALSDFDAAEPLMRQADNLRYLAMLYRARSRSLEAAGNHAAALADLRRYIEAHEALDAKAHAQNTALLRFQFDTARRDADNRRLAAEGALHAQEISSLESIRRWQTAAIVLGVLLTVVAIALAIMQLRRARGLHALAMTDELTDLPNRRRIQLFAEDALARALAEHTPLTLLQYDIDHFKRVNDTWGHDAGDEVLVAVSAACKAALRQFDLVGRIGGEEFLVVLPRSALEESLHIAERLRTAVESLDLDHLARGLKVTISMGVASLRPDERELRNLLRRADAALYRAKGGGRNRVEHEG